MTVTRTKLTPPEVAARFGVAVGKVLSWVHSGELRAIDAATRRGDRPRFLIDEADIAAFERSREVTPAPTRAKTRLRSRRATDYVQYFEE